MIAKRETSFVYNRKQRLPLKSCKGHTEREQREVIVEHVPMGPSHALKAITVAISASLSERKRLLKTSPGKLNFTAPGSINSTLSRKSTRLMAELGKKKRIRDQNRVRTTQEMHREMSIGANGGIPGKSAEHLLPALGAKDSTHDLDNTEQQALFSCS